MSKDEALIPLDWVHRHEEADVELPELVEDSAERGVPWSISAALEKLLAEPFRRDYAELLDEAKRRTCRSEQ